MVNGNQKQRPRKFVSASELAQMGACERYIAFEKRYGKIRSPEQIKAMQRGNNAHDKFHREALTVNPRVRSSLEAKPWCFIERAATLPTRMHCGIRNSRFGRAGFYCR